MTKTVVVDTSSFVDFFRYGKSEIIARLAMNDRILLSRIVRLELLKGTRREDRIALLTFLDGLHQLGEFSDAFMAESTLLRLHGRGLSLGIADLLILTDAARSGSSLLTKDRALARAASALRIPVLPA